MSVFVTTTDLLEEIVETTEEQEADLCSSGETVDECVTDGIIGEFIEVHEHKYQPVTVSVSGSATRSSSSLQGSSAGSSSQRERSHKSSSSRSSSSSTQNGQFSGSVASANPSGTSISGTNAANSASTNSRGSSRGANHHHMEQEKRMRREIANSNERRRMQSINAGFQSLRTLLPHHEGEKLSKAAILQQTAEYIYQLEQQKTQLLSQNLQLKRLVGEHEGGDVPPKKRRGENGTPVLIGMSIPGPVNESGDEGLGSMSPEPLSVITVSADGPTLAVPSNSNITSSTNNNNNNTNNNNNSNSSNGSTNEVAELKRQLERERSIRLHLEKQVKSMQTQIFPAEQRFHESQLITYHPHEVIEHTNNVLAQDLEDGIQVVSVVSVPTVGSTQTIETSNADSDTPPMSPQTGCEVIVPSEPPSPLDSKEVSVGDLLQIKSRPTSPVTLVSCFSGVQVFASTLDDQQQSSKSTGGNFVTYSTVASLPIVNATPSGNTVELETVRIQGQSLKTAFITASPTRSFSPEQQQQPQQSDDSTQQLQQPEQQRLPSVLEAAIKAEPKVEVERLPSPSNSLDDGTPQARLYLANTSRQNLETIVEAIRHLEGDHMFSDEPAQDAPLALTNKRTLAAAAAAANSEATQHLHAEVNNFLQFHSTTQPQQQSATASTSSISNSTSTSTSTSSSSTSSSSATLTPNTLTSSRTPQVRPGVIVVKHS